eukprot:Nk52_evm41s221 gene=Nk52_evmTU41s221
MSKRSPAKNNGNSPKKAKGITRIWVDGCYDMMHFGHANSLRQAKLFGDELYVGVHSDAEILKNKGPTVMNEQERYKMVRACKWVDKVIEDAPYQTQLEVMDEYGCQYVAHGDDITTLADGTDCYQLCKDAGRYKEFGRTEGVSTTNLVGRMLLMTKDHHQKGEKLDKKDPTLKSVSSGNDKRSPYTGVSQFLPTTQKIIQFSEGKAPKPGDKIVYTAGAFDLFHVGHIDFLEKVKKLGNFVIVGLHTDEVVNSYKGRNYPIMNLHERVLSVLACRYVDEVVIGAPYEIDEALLSHFKISVVAHGSTFYPEQNGRDPYALAKKKKIYKSVASGSTITTSVIVERIIKNRLEYEARNKKKEAKEMKLMDDIHISTPTRQESPSPKKKTGSVSPKKKAGSVSPKKKAGSVSPKKK